MDRYIAADSNYFKAHELIKENKISDAIQLLKSITNDSSFFLSAILTLGWLYETKVIDLEFAELYYVKALEFDGENPSAYFSYLNLLVKQNRTEKLKEHLDKGVNLKSTNKAKLFNEYGKMLELEGNYKEAVLYFKKSIKELEEESKNMYDFYKKRIDFEKIKPTLNQFLDDLI